jgi:hypothetical protein
VLKLDEARPPSPSLSQCAHHVNFEMWVSTLDGSASGPLLRRKRGKGTLSVGSKILTELDFLAALEHCEVVTRRWWPTHIPVEMVFDQVPGLSSGAGRPRRRSITTGAPQPFGAAGGEFTRTAATYRG